MNYFPFAKSWVMLFVVTFSLNAQSQELDTDNDGIPNHVDADDDNDGILDVLECMTSNFKWSNAPIVNGKTATGIINGVGYTYTSSINIETTPAVFSHATFPNNYNVPNIRVIKNRLTSTNHINFNEPILNPTLLFSSIGSGSGSGLAVPIQFSDPVEVLFQSGVVLVNAPDRITGTEGYVILRMNGVFDGISFDYLANENYVNFTFGADFATFCDTDADGTPDYLDLDSDDDGCPDAVEGGAGFKLSDVNSDDVLAGLIDAQGVPLAANGGQTKGSSADALTESAVCEACDTKTPSINGVTEDSFHQFYMDAIQPLNETVNGFAAGERYKIKVTGTYSLWSNDPANNVVDAAYRYKEKYATADITPIDFLAWNLNGGFPSRPIPEGYNLAHTYYFECVATGNGEIFTWEDDNYGDNGGGMNFDFYKILDTIRVCASASVTPLSDFVVGQDLKWYSTETSLDGSSVIPNLDNSIIGLTEYWVTQTIGGCESERVQLLYLVNDVPIVNLGTDTTICEDSTVTFDALVGEAWEWSNGDKTQIITVSAAGDFFVEVTNANGCIGYDTVNISVEQCAESLCGGDINFNTWTQAGISSQGDWVVSADGKSVNQTINGTPTFFNGKRDYLNVKFSGKMRTDFGRDNDWMGMVFGYQGDELTTDYPITLKTYVFAWKQEDQTWSGRPWSEGFSLLEVNRTITGENDFWDAFETPYIGSTLLASDFGQDKGYTTGVDYKVSIEYTSSKIKIYVDDDLIFDLDGCFDAGKIGFYNASQPEVNYSDFTYQFIGNIEMVEDTLCVGDQLEVSVYEGPVCNAASYYPVGAIFDWDLKDGTEFKQNKVKHVYDSAGVYDVQLIVSDGTGCADTSYKKAYVGAYPTKELGPDTTVCKLENMELDAMNNGVSYLWSSNETTRKISINTSGEHRVELRSWAACITKDTINVLFGEGLNVDLGNDTTICSDSTITFGVTSGALWNWSDGSNAPTITVNSSGEFSVIVEDTLGCKSYDTVNLVMQAVPVIDLGNDTTICRDSTITFDADIGTEWSWSNGINTQTITVNSTGSYSVTVEDAIRCTGYDTINLIMQAVPLVNLGNDTTICADSSITLDPAIGAAWNWSNGSNTPMITVSTAGSYSVMVEDAIRCAGYDTINLVMQAVPIIDLGNDTIICSGDLIQLLLKNIGLNYLWNNGAISQGITIGSTGIYGVDVTDNIGCFGSDSMNLTVNKLPKVDLGGDTTICEWDSWELDAGNPGLSFLWGQESGLGSRLQKRIVNDQGQYKVTVTDSIGCQGSDSMFLFIDLIPDLFEDKTYEMCQGDTTSLFPSKQGPSFEVSWLEYSNTQDTMMVINAGIYNGLVVSHHCQDTFPVEVSVLDTPMVNIIDVRLQESYCFDFERPLLKVVGPDADVVDLMWFPSEEITHQFEPIHPGNQILVADDGRCKSTHQIKLVSYCKGQLFIPNAFTPNGDGTNDEYIAVSFHVEDYSLLIYDRWGTVLFESTDPAKGWNGIYKGNEVQQDVYVYKLSYSYPDEHGGNSQRVYTGTVALIR